MISSILDFFNVTTLIDYLDQLPPETRKVMQDYLAHCDEHEALPAEAEAEKERGDAEEIKDDFLFAVVDQRHLIERPSIKWYNPFTNIGDRTGKSRLTKKKGMCFHHSAVTNGFGPRKSVLLDYKGDVVREFDLDEDALDTEAIAANDVLGYADKDAAIWTRLNQEITGKQWARAMAIAGRMRGEGPKDRFNNGVPYQAIRCANSVLVLNLPFDWVTWHGNGSNTDFIGFGWDANSRKENIEDADDLIADVVFTVELARSEGHPVTEFTCHCCWTNKPTDPGAEFIELVMIPAAEKLGVTIDFDFKANRKYRSIREVLKAA